MKHLIVAALLAAIITIPVLAQNIEQQSPTTFSGTDFVRNNGVIGIAPSLGSNSALAATSTAAFPNGVWRNDYATGFGAVPLFFRPQVTTCTAAGFVNDAGSCVNSVDGKSWLAVYPENRVDLDQFGATATSNSATQMQAAMIALAARGGGTLTGSRTYRIDTQVSGYSNVNIDITGTVDGSRWVTANSGLISYTGTISSPINLGNNATTDDTVLTTAAVTGWSIGDWFLLLSQRCALYPEAGFWQLGHYTQSGTSPRFGEVFQIQGISGNDITLNTSVFYPSYNTVPDAGSTCPNTATSSTVAKINWITNVDIHIAHIIMGGGGVGVGLRWVLNPTIRIDDAQLGKSIGRAAFLKNVYGADVTYRAYRPADFVIVSDHSAYNSVRMEGVWNINVTQHDVNGSQGTDVSYSGSDPTNMNINVKGDSINSKETGTTFHAGTLGGSIGPFQCYGARLQCIIVRSRRINVHDIIAQELQRPANSQDAVRFEDGAMEFSVSNINVLNYNIGVRVTKYQDAGPIDGRVDRKVLISNINCDRARSCIFIGGSDTHDYPTNLHNGIVIRGVSATRTDVAVHVGTYQNGTDIDGVTTDSTSSIGILTRAAVYTVGNSANTKIGAVSGKIPSSGSLVLIGALSDLTTFPTVTYPWGYHSLSSDRWIVTGGGSLLSIADEVPIVSDYIAQVGDNLRPRQCNSATPIAITIPHNSTVPFARGQSISIVQIGAGQCFFAADSGVSVRAQAGAKTSGQYATITATLHSPNVWYVTGQTAP